MSETKMDASLASPFLFRAERESPFLKQIVKIEGKMPAKRKVKEFDQQFYLRNEEMAEVLRSLAAFSSLPASNAEDVAFEKLVGTYTELLIGNAIEEHKLYGKSEDPLPEITKSKVDKSIQKILKTKKYKLPEIVPAVLTHFAKSVLQSIPGTLEYLKIETKKKAKGRIRGYATERAEELDREAAAAEAKRKKEARKAMNAARPKVPKLSKEEIEKLRAQPGVAIDLRLYDIQMAKAEKIHKFIKDFFAKWSTKNAACTLSEGSEEENAAVECDSRPTSSKRKKVSPRGRTLDIKDDGDEDEGEVKGDEVADYSRRAIPSSALDAKAAGVSSPHQHAFECLEYSCHHGDQNPAEEKGGSSCDRTKKGAKRKQTDEPRCRKPSAKSIQQTQPPRPEQAAVGRRFVDKKQRALLLAWKAGSGKSLAAVIAAECALEEARQTRKKVPKVVVITKKSLLTNFEKNIKRYGRDCEWIDEHYQFFAIEWLTHPPGGQISIEQLRSECRNGIVIIDESHELRHPAGEEEGKFAAEAIRLCETAWKVLLMTGTPLVNKISDIYNTAFMFTKPNSAERKAFVDAFPFAIWMDAYPNYTKEQVAALNQVFSCRVSTIDLGKVPLHFPSSYETNVLVEMDTKFEKDYVAEEKTLASKPISRAEMARILRGALEANVQNKSAFHSQLRQAVNNLEGVTSPKIEFIVERALANKALGRTMVVHSQFIKAGLEPIRAALEAKKIRVREISGKDSSAASRDCAVELINSRKLDVLMISEAGATGIDLKGVSEMINLEAFWNESEREQANARVVRYMSHENLPNLGKKFPPIETHVLLYNLYLAKPADMKTYYFKMQADADAKKPGAAKAVMLAGAISAKKRAQIRAAYEKEKLQKKRSPPKPVASASSPRKSPERTPPKSPNRTPPKPKRSPSRSPKASPAKRSPSPPRKKVDPLKKASNWEL